MQENGEKKKKNGFKISFKKSKKKNEKNDVGGVVDEESSSTELSSVLRRLNSLEKQLEQRQVELETRIANEYKQAEKYKNGNQQLYNRAQQRRKLYEKQLSVVDGTLTTLEVQRQALDSAQLNEEINELTENNADALNQEQKRVDIDKVKSVIDAIEEERTRINELNEAMANPKIVNDVDDNELLRELERLEASDRRKQNEQLPRPSPMPPQIRPSQPMPASIPPFVERQLYPQINDDRPIYSGGRIMGDRVAANQGLVTVQVGREPAGLARSSNGSGVYRDYNYEPRRRVPEFDDRYRGQIYDEPPEDRYYNGHSRGAQQHGYGNAQYAPQSHNGIEQRSFVAMRRPYRGGNELYGVYQKPEMDQYQATRAFIANERNATRRRGDSREAEMMAYARPMHSPKAEIAHGNAQSSHRARSVPRMVFIDEDQADHRHGGYVEKGHRRHAEYTPL